MAPRCSMPPSRRCTRPAPGRIPQASNTIDGGRYFYRVYACSDGLLISVGAIEPAFRAVLLEKLGLAGDPAFADDDAARWKQTARQGRRRVRDQDPGRVGRLVRGHDGCVAPVLSMDEAETHPQARARNAFPVVDGVSQPAPGPRFSETPGEIRITPEEATRSDPAALAAWGFSPDAISALCSQGIFQLGRLTCHRRSACHECRLRSPVQHQLSRRRVIVAKASRGIPSQPVRCQRPERPRSIR